MFKRDDNYVWRLIALAGFLAVVSCAHAPRGDGCSLPGNGQWREYRSKHFLIDAEEGADPGKLVAALEGLHAAVVQALFKPPIEIPTRVRVLALPSREDVLRVVDALGIFAPTWVYDREPTIVISAEDVAPLPQILAHELAHMVSYYVVPRQKPWFTEGLAQFVESVATVDFKGRRWAGGQPQFAQYAGRIPLMPTEELFNADIDTRRAESGAFYVTSWLLYRYLWNERDVQFTDYWRRLQNGESPDDAWHGAFPEWDPSMGTMGRLDRELEYYQRTAAMGQRFEVKVGEVHLSFTSEPASRAQMHMLFLFLELGHTDPSLRTQLERQAVEEALREEPDYPWALAELARLEGKPVLRAMRAATASHPKDGLGWYLLGHAAKEPAEREAALRAAVAVWPEFAMARAELAWLLASTGRAREALPMAERAVKLAPWNPLTVASLGEVAMELGQCKRAMVLLTRAVELWEAFASERTKSVNEADKAAHRQKAAELRRKLADYRTRC